MVGEGRDILNVVKDFAKTKVTECEIEKRRGKDCTAADTIARLADEVDDFYASCSILYAQNYLTEEEVDGCLEVLDKVAEALKKAAEQLLDFNLDEWLEAMRPFRIE